MNSKAILKVLEEWFKDHRGLVMCSEDCLCWDIEFAIDELREMGALSTEK